MGNVDSLVDRYLSAWNETDAAARRKLIDDVFADDIRYVDPMAAVTGRDELDGLIAAVQQQFPGLTFTVGGPVDGHHDQVRFTWNLGVTAGDPLVVGFDVAELDAAGRIIRVLGFLDKVPA